jgi:hypothetical protein
MPSTSLRNSMMTSTGCWFHVFSPEKDDSLLRAYRIDIVQ